MYNFIAINRRNKMAGRYGARKSGRSRTSRRPHTHRHTHPHREHGIDDGIGSACYSCEQHNTEWWPDGMQACMEAIGPAGSNPHGCSWDQSVDPIVGCYCMPELWETATGQKCCNPHDYWERSSGGRMQKGGKVNSGRFSGRTQNNPKGKFKK